MRFFAYFAPNVLKTVGNVPAVTYRRPSHDLCFVQTVQDTAPLHGKRTWQLVAFPTLALNPFSMLNTFSSKENIAKSVFFYVEVS